MAAPPRRPCQAMEETDSENKEGALRMELCIRTAPPGAATLGETTATRLARPARTRLVRPAREPTRAQMVLVVTRATEMVKVTSHPDTDTTAPILLPW